MRDSLLRRMILAQGLALMLAWSLLLAIVIAPLVWYRKSVWDDELELMASALLLLLQDETDQSQLKFQASRILEFHESRLASAGLGKPEDSQSVYQILDREGRLLFRSEAAPKHALRQRERGFHHQEINGRRYRLFVKDDPISGLRVLAAQPEALGYLGILMSIKQIPFYFLAGFVAVAVFTWLISRKGLRPLRQLAETVESRNPGDLSPLVGTSTQAEISLIVAALNTLFLRVEELVAAQKRFVADAAHELRTPLAVIGAQSHILSHAKDVAQRDAAGVELKQGVDRAWSVVAQLRSVARLDSVNQNPVMGLLDLAVLARERIGMLLSQAQAKAQGLSYEGPESLPWMGNAPILVSAVDNLLVNGIRYSPGGGRIILRLAALKDEARLEVEDSGPGIPSEYRETVFCRFSRLQGTVETGSGLGLAIVRRAVELHGGSVALLDGSGGLGLRAVIRLPRRQA